MKFLMTRFDRVKPYHSQKRRRVLNEMVQKVSAIRISLARRRKVLPPEIEAKAEELRSLLVNEMFRFKKK